MTGDRCLATLVALVTLVGCGPARVQAPYPVPEGLPGISDLVWLDGARYLAVLDTKDRDAGPRLAEVLLDPARPPALRWIPVSDWHDPRGRASDLEGVCTVPGRPGEVLVVESGSWQGRPGRLFRLTLHGDRAVVEARADLPVLADNTPDQVGDQYEGLACAPAGDGRVLVILGERGGSDAHPVGRIRWATWDLEAGVLSWTAGGRQGVPVTSPGQWLRAAERRHVTALHLADDGVLWAAAAEEGGDTGPFRSVVYLVGRLQKADQSAVVVEQAPAVAWAMVGTKVEGLAAPPAFWRFALLVAASEDEALGGRIAGLEAVGPGGPP